MAQITCTRCISVIFLALTITWLPGDAVYVESRRSQRQRPSSERDRERRERQGSRAQDADTEEDATVSRSRAAFQRTLVFCTQDSECGRKYFCHGGEGHKSCVHCRKTGKRCHRDEMCCRGHVCQDGRCIPHENRFDSAYIRAVISDSSSTGGDDSFQEESFLGRQEGQSCSGPGECARGLCCAQHLWSKICKPLLQEGDICTKKRDRLTDIFQRCDCDQGLNCKRVPDVNVKLYSCHVVKTHQNPEVVVVDSETADTSQHTSEQVVDVALSVESNRRRVHPPAEPNEPNERKAVYAVEESATSAHLRSSRRRSHDSVAGSPDLETRNIGVS